MPNNKLIDFVDLKPGQVFMIVKSEGFPCNDPMVYTKINPFTRGGIEYRLAAVVVGGQSFYYSGYSDRGCWTCKVLKENNGIYA